MSANGREGKGKWGREGEREGEEREGKRWEGKGGKVMEGRGMGACMHPLGFSKVGTYALTAQCSD